MSNPSSSDGSKSTKPYSVKHHPWMKTYLEKKMKGICGRMIKGRYKLCSNILRYAEENNVSALQAAHHLKSNLKALKVLTETALYHKEEIDYLINKFDISNQFPRFDIYLLKILITEILWVKHHLNIKSQKPAIFYHEANLQESFVEAAKMFNKLQDSTVPILPVYVRINTLAISLQDGINAFLDEGWKLLPKCKNYSEYLKVVGGLKDNNFLRDFHISELLVFPSDTVFYNHPGHLEKKFFIQDKGSCLSSFLLNPKPGSLVLDMCAAPGLKTSHLASIINNEGTILACDDHPDRWTALQNLVKSARLKCVKPILKTSLKFREKDGVNYILVDAPSTYSGIFYNNRKKLSKQPLERSFEYSSALLRYALQNFTEVKRVVYTSCSKYFQETQKVISDAIREVRGAYTLLDAKEMLWNEWREDDELSGHPYRKNKCLVINPLVDLCEGYFIAVFERNPEVPIPEYVNRRAQIVEKDEEDSEDDNDDDVIRDNNAEEVTSKSKSFAHKKSYPGQGPKAYGSKPHHFSKPYIKNPKYNGKYAPKIKAPKFQASSSTYPQ